MKSRPKCGDVIVREIYDDLVNRRTAFVEVAVIMGDESWNQ